MKKLITFILLLLSLVSYSQVREEKISTPMLICSNNERTKWFVMVTNFVKSNDIVTKTYLYTVKLNIGECSKDDVIVFTFTDGTKRRILSNNEKNCDGILENIFNLNAIDVAFLEMKTLESIRYINGNDFVSFVYFSKPEDSNFFSNTIVNYKN